MDLPIRIIDEFNRLEQGDPRIHLYQLNPVWGPGVKEFGFFLDRYESTKEVLCMFVWSTVDKGVGKKTTHLDRLGYEIRIGSLLAQDYPLGEHAQFATL